ncbi:MAG: tRNA (guanosine(37)-N1)-methyltransferase TrmD, partial [bacterium]|nr:tRNA (guanosine(37)-N1)-methyltransferase TrmD [bacterium]
MNISIVTVFPELYESFLKTSLIKRAQENNIVHFDIDRFSSFVSPKERIDAPTFGPGPGMLIRPEVVQKAVEDKEKKYGSSFKIFFSPQGHKLDQRKLEQITHRARQSEHLMLLPARYEGMDARVEQEYADEIISVGDFVLMGGDIPAMMLLEGMLRLIPGVVGKEESVKEESFTGPFVDYPQFTEPVEWKGKVVPDIVRSGNHAAINQWRMQHAIFKTVREHFSWLRSHFLTSEQRKQVKECVPHHYVVLTHGDVLIGDQRTIGSTSVTTID